MSNANLQGKQIGHRAAYSQSATLIERGDFVVVLLSAGTAQAAQDTADGGAGASSGYKFVGMAINQSDNRSDSTNPPALGKVVVDRAESVLVTFDTIAATDVGKKAYAKSKQVASLDTQSSKAVYVGIVTEYVSSTSAWIDIVPGVLAAAA